MKQVHFNIWFEPKIQNATWSYRLLKIYKITFDVHLNFSHLLILSLENRDKD